MIILFLTAIMLSFGVASFYGYFYPMKYVELIKRESVVAGVDPSVIATVINIESGYKSDRVSPKGAIGLMQVMPTTAQWVCSRRGEVYDENLLFEPEYNIKIGAYYLGYLISYFGEVENAVCAYNAGMGNVKNWLANKQYSQDGKTLRVIPFKETQNYILKFKKNLRYYKNRYQSA